MAPLRNPRHERFAQALFEGEPASRAYETAGYVPNDGNAIRLKGNEKVKARLPELQEAVAKEHEVTVSSLLAELEAAREKASNLDQLSAAVRAIEAKAKVSGLLVNRTEIGAPGDFDKCETIAEVAGTMLDSIFKDSLNPSYQIPTERDRQQLVDLLMRQFAEVGELIDAIKARPVAGITTRPALTHGNSKFRP